jgi:small subunit ribosomal protein S9
MADEPEQQDAAEREGNAPADGEATSAAPIDSAPGDAGADAPVDATAAGEPAGETAETAKPKAQKRRRKAKASDEEPAGAEPTPEAEPAQVPAAAEPVAAGEATAEVPAAPEPAPAAAAAEAPAAEAPTAEAPEAESAGAAEKPEPAEGQREGSRAKPEVPGAHLEVDIVPEGVDPLGRAQPEDPYAIGYEEEGPEEPVAEEEELAEVPDEDEEVAEPIVSAAIDLAAGARYRATGKRKTAVARVILRPGAGEYTINGRSLAEYFPRATLQRNIAQPLESVGYQERMDVVARLHGGGVSSQAGALRHGISRALLEADPNLRGELKRRGFLTRDSRVKERKKAGLKKARKRPQFSKR